MANQKPKKIFSALNVALMAMWAALLVVSSMIPAYPVLSTSVMITFSSIMLAGLTAVLLGPLYGTLAALIFGMIIPYANPASSIGPFTFLAPTMAALMGGLFIYNRWKEATLILGIQVAIWFANPFSWYQLMPLVVWGVIPVFVFLLVPPVRKWIINTIVNLDTKYLPAALWCLAWVARTGGEAMTGNNIYLWVFSFTGESNYGAWAPLTIYYGIADSVMCIVAALIGTAVLLALQRSGIHITAIDRLRQKQKTAKPIPILN